MPKITAREQLENAIDAAIENVCENHPAADLKYLYDWLMLIAISYKYQAHQEPGTDENGQVSEPQE